MRVPPVGDVELSLLFSESDELDELELSELPPELDVPAEVTEPVLMLVSERPVRLNCK